MRKIRPFFLLVAFIVFLSLLLGCQPQKKEVKPPVKEERVVLQMWVMPNSMEPLKDVEDLLKPFEKTHPNIKIVVTSVDWGAAWTKITTAATSGDVPDIVQLGSTWVGSISGMGALYDMKDRLSELGGPQIFLPVAWVTSGLEGTGSVTSIPWFVDVRAMFYRGDVFKEGGLKVKDVDDWKSFEKALNRIYEADLEIEGVPVDPLGIPGKNDWNVIHNMAPWIWGAGGDYLSADRSRCVLDSQEALEGLTYYVGLVRQGLVPLDCLELNTAQVSSNFNNGSYAVYFDGPYEVKALTIPPEQGGALGSIASRSFGVALYPAGPKGRYNFVGGSNLAIFKASQHKQEAFEVIKYLSSYDAQVAYAKVTGFLPSRRDAFEDPFISADPYRRVFKTAVKYGRTYPCISAWGIMEPILIRRFGIMWDHIIGVQDEAKLKEIIKEELKLAAKEVNMVLAQER